MEIGEKQWQNKTMSNANSSTMQFIGSPNVPKLVIKKGGTVVSRNSVGKPQRSSMNPYNNHCDNSNNSIASGGAYSTSSKSRGLYRAPQPTLRKSTSASLTRSSMYAGSSDQQRKVISGVELLSSKASVLLTSADKTGNTRRRRRDNTSSSVTCNSASVASSNKGGGGHRQGQRHSGSYCTLERQSSDNSLDVEGLLSQNSDVENADDYKSDEDEDEEDDEDHEYHHPNIHRRDSSSRSHHLTRGGSDFVVEDFSNSSSRRSNPRRTAKQMMKSATTPTGVRSVAMLGPQHQLLLQRNNHQLFGNSHSRGSSKVSIGSHHQQQQQHQYNASFGSSSKIMQYHNQCHDSFSDHHYNYNSNNNYNSNQNNSHDGGVGDEMVALNYQSDILFVESGGDVGHSSVKQPLYKRWLKTMKTLQSSYHTTKSHPSGSSTAFYCCKLLPLRFSSYISNLRNAFLGTSSVPIKLQPSTWLMQVFMFIVCAGIIYDSQRTIRQNRIILQRYDEERAHLLEQMTWIDRAAKRVRSTYQIANEGKKDASTAAQILLGASSTASNVSGVGGIVNEGKMVNVSNNGSGSNLSHADRLKLIENAQNDRDAARREMERMQIRIQSNARDRNHQQFGDKPIHISLPIYPEDFDPSSFSKDDIDHLVIALWDDTPHAVSTLLQQINKKIWDNIDIQRLETSINPIPGQFSSHDHKLDSIQISPKLSDSVSVSPALEFVEKSRSCYHPGSVSLHQLESDDFHFIVLKVHITEESRSVHHGDEDDVCVGTVISGMDTLQRLLPSIPVVHKEFDDIEDADPNDLPCDEQEAKTGTSESDKGVEREHGTSIGPVTRESE